LAVTVSSLSGCVDNYLPDDVSGNEEEITEPTDTDEDETDETEKTDVDEQEGPQPRGTTLPERVSALVSYTDWVAERYDDARFRYKSDIQDSADALVALSQMDPQTIRNTELEEAAVLLRDTGETADTEFGRYYNTRYSFESLARRLETEIQDDIRRGEYQHASDTIDDISRSVRRQMRDSEVFDWFPRYTVFRNPYQYFTSGDRSETNKLFEVFCSAGENEAGLYATPERMNIGQQPLGREQSPGAYDIGPQVFPDRTSTLFDRSAWLTADPEPTSELYLNIIDYALEDSEYPDGYLYDSADDKEVDDLTTPDFNRPPKLSVYIQTFEDEQAAEAVVEALESKGEVDGETEHFGEPYTQLFYIDSEADDTFYADVRQTENYVLAVDVSDTQWSNRTIENLSDDETRTERLLRDTFVDLVSNKEDEEDE